MYTSSVPSTLSDSSPIELTGSSVLTGSKRGEGNESSSIDIRGEEADQAAAGASSMGNENVETTTGTTTMTTTSDVDNSNESRSRDPQRVMSTFRLGKPQL